MPQTPILVKSQHPRGSEVRVVRQEYNKLRAKVRALCVALDADAGVAGTGYTAAFDQADGPSPVYITANPAD